MGVILELARAKQRIIVLVAENARLKEQTPIPIVPVTDLIMVSRSDYLAKMASVGIKPIDMNTPLDTALSLTSKVELDRIAPFLVQGAGLYIAQIRDCEDYGIEAQSRAADFHVSAVRLGLGNCSNPQINGYHGFAITMDKEFNIWWLEPNAGFEYAGVWFKIGEYGYIPDKIFA